MALTKEEKIEIVGQHIKNLDYNKYNITLSIVEENAASVPNQSVLDSLSVQEADIDAKINALNAELTELNAVNG